MNYSFVPFSLQENIPFKVSFEYVTLVPEYLAEYTEILFVIKGETEITASGRTSHLSLGDVYLVNRYTVASLKSIRGCLMIKFTLSLKKYDIPLNELKSYRFRLDSSADPDNKHIDSLRRLLSQIVLVNSSPDESSLFQNKAFGYSLLRSLTKHFRLSEKDPDEILENHAKRIKELFDLVNRDYLDNLSLTDLSEKLSVSPNYLSSVFSASLHTTFLTYYNDVRIANALPLLETRNLSSESVAYESGFSNPQAFVRAFKSAFGMSPNQYRLLSDKIEIAEKDIDRHYIENYLFDTSFLNRFSSDKTSNTVSPEEITVPREIAASYEVSNSCFTDNYRQIIGVGSCKQILYRPIQEQLEAVQKHIHFRYVKFHGILSDEMLIVSRDATDNIIYSFKLLDMVFDYLATIDLKPVLELSFMPVALSSDPKRMIMSNKYNISAPEKNSDWLNLIRALLNHLIVRYGKEYVESLPVLIWHNPDTRPEMFAMEDMDKYAVFYMETFRMIKTILPDIKIGSPSLSFMDVDATENDRRMLRTFYENNILPDFASADFYNVQQLTKDITINLLNWKDNHVQNTKKNAGLDYSSMGIPLSTNENELCTFSEQVHQIFRNAFHRDIPLSICEWNSSLSHRNLIHDTLFQGCFIIKNVLENTDRIQSVGYWNFTDFLEEQQIPEDIFHGGMGLMTSDGIKKPSFLAFELLGKLAENILCREPGCFISRGSDRITILSYNYQHYNDLFANNQNYNMTRTSRDNVFDKKDRIRFSVSIHDLNGYEVVSAKEYIVSKEHGSSYDLWVGMGSPVIQETDSETIEYLRSNAKPFIRFLKPKVSGNTLKYECLLEHLEFRLAEIRIRKKEA